MGVHLYHPNIGVGTFRDTHVFSKWTFVEKHNADVRLMLNADVYMGKHSKNFSIKQGSYPNIKKQVLQR